MIPKPLVLNTAWEEPISWTYYPYVDSLDLPVGHNEPLATSHCSSVAF